MWVFVLLALSAFVLALARATAFRRTDIPDSLPWVGKSSKGLCSETLAHLKSFGNVRSLLVEGYAKYSQKGKSYVFPDLSGVPQIILPNSKTKWLVDQADDVANPGAAHYELLEGEYAFTTPHLLKSLFHEHVLHRNLARRLAGLMAGTWEELCLAFDETWGNNTTEWTSICVFQNMMHIVARPSNRMFVGAPLCRNTSYLAHMAAFAQDVMKCAALMRFVPRPLRPIFGPFFSIPTRLDWQRTKKYTKPLIEQRLADMERKRMDPDFKWEAPNDYLTWHIELGLAEGNTKELEPDMISRYLMPINFAAIHTTTFTMTTALFNLLSSDPKKRYVEQLREEAEHVLAEAGGVWTKQALNKMVKTDSALRESIRLSNFGSKGCLRKVVAKDGLYNEDEGWTAPYGTLVSVDIYNLHQDPEIYRDPFSYDAFRFSNLREEFERKPVEERDEKATLKMKQLGIVTTGETFLAFGHGRHACPGRFFINQELKMLLAYMLTNYDLQPLAERPKDTWFGETVVPDTKATIQVRRRTRTAVT